MTTNRVTAKVIVLDNLTKNYLKHSSGQDLIDAVMAGGYMVEAYAKINANRVFSGKSTGGAGLVGSIQTVMAYADNEKAEVDVGPTVIYGRIHELGGLIRPVFKKFLHFWIDGKEVFTKLSHMPARPYLRPAVDEHEVEIRNAIGNTLAEAMMRGTGEG